MIRHATALLLLATAIVLMSATQLLFKARFSMLARVHEQTVRLTDIIRSALADPLMWVAGAMLLIAAAGWYLSMLRLPISLMLPLASLVAPIATIGAWLILGEPVTPAKLTAILVIAAGAAWLGWLNS
jgi:drug/metabolite transporter (DMT)-like permease